MMQSEKPSFVFFGSGPVAAESLRLLAQDFAIEAIVTKPTTKQEMGAILPETPLFTVSRGTELDELFTEHKFSSKLGVLIDFGIIVSRQIIDYFEHGIINSHFSLLPELRGADPISFAILEGKQKTGVSLMLLVEAMDEGPLLTIGEQPLTGNETTPTLTRSLILLSDSLLKSGIPKYISGKIKPAPQSFIEERFGLRPSYTRKLAKQDGFIDWSKPAEQIEREIRAYSEWPKSRTEFNGLEVVITQASVLENFSEALENGKLTMTEDKKLVVQCGEKLLSIEKIKPAGKSEMDARSFINGYGKYLR